MALQIKAGKQMSVKCLTNMCHFRFEMYGSQRCKIVYTPTSVLHVDLKSILRSLEE